MKSAKPCCLLVLLLACPLLHAEGQATTAPTATMSATSAATAPAPSLTQQDQQLVASIKVYVQQQARLLGSDDPRQRQKAQAALDELQSAILAPLKQDVTAGKQFDSQTEQVLAGLYTDVVLQRMLEGMSPADRERTLQFSKDNPEIIKQMCSSNAATRRQGYTDMPRKDPSRQAEPLLLAAVLSNDYSWASDATIAFASGRYDSDRVVDVMGDLATGKRGAALAPPGALTILMGLSNPRVAPYAMATLLKAPADDATFINIHEYRVAAATLTRFNEVGAVQTLMKDLAPTPVIATAQVPQQSITTAYSDMKVYAVCILTKQDPKSYGIVAWPADSPQPSYMGFENDAARSKAVTKLRAWWEQEKDKPPYKDAKPLLPAGASSRPAAQARPEAQP